MRRPNSLGRIVDEVECQKIESKTKYKKKQRKSLLLQVAPRRYTPIT